jgi:predicted dehydrogenase
MSHSSLTRREFVRLATSVAATRAVMKFSVLEPDLLLANSRVIPPSDRVRFASIGTGVRGCELLQASLRVPGIECVGVCDLYDSRHDAAKEAVKKNVAASRDYRKILDRKDVDAVIVATADHQHRRVLVDACAAGKDVYCEKPMSHTVEDGFSMVDAAQKANRMIQIGSQGVSSIVYAKAKEIYSSGKLGDVFLIEAYSDRNSASGAWAYPIPSDASEQTIDWSAFLDGAPKRAFDPVRFFRWRCFRDYGEGLAGDLFVHLISGIHFITNANAIAQRAQSTGGIFRWKDGREYPDLLETFYDYPHFRMVLRCNLNNDAGGLLVFYGTQGTMTIKDSTVSYKPEDTRPQPEGYSIYGWPARLRDEYLRKWNEEHPSPAPLDFHVEEEGETFAAPSGYDAVADHQTNFFNAVRSRKPVVENEVFGNNAAIGCHMANYAYFNKAVAVWDAVARKITTG